MNAETIEDVIEKVLRPFVIKKNYHNIKPNEIYMSSSRYVEIDEPFNTKYPTWIIAFCPDTDSFFATNERHFFWEFKKEFESEESAVDYFSKHVDDFIEVNNKIMNKIIYGWIPVKSAFLENNNTWYS